MNQPVEQSNRGGKVAVILLLTLTAAGCFAKKTVTTKPTLPIPPSWNQVGSTETQSPAGDLTQWWKRLNDANLSRLIDRAWQNNTDIRTAQSRLREARAQRDLASANRFPTFTASVAGSGNKSTGPTGSTSGLFSAAFDASWEPDVFGGTRAALRAANADLRAAQANLENSRVSLTAEVARNYVEFRAYEKRISIARENEASQVETLQLTEWRSQAGLVSSVDVEQARTNLEQTRAQIPIIETNQAENENQLATLLGVNVSEVKQIVAQPGAIPSLPDEVAVGIPAEALRQRPDIRSAEQKIIAEIARLRQSEAKRYPSFSLSGALGLEQVLGGPGSAGAVSGGSTVALSGGTTILGSLAGSMLQTLFDRGRIRQQINIQSAVEEQAVITYEATVLTAIQDVENALVSFRKSREQLAALRKAANSAHNAAVLARNRYEAGLIDFQTVLDTERSEMTVLDSVAQTEASRATALIQLYKALGGGWSPAVVISSSTKQESHS